jgi:HEAT repeat protein
MSENKRVIIIVLSCLSLWALPDARAQVPTFKQTPYSGLRGLQSLDVNTRQSAAHSLTRFRRNPGVRAALIATLQQDPNAQVRQAAARVLSKMGAKGRRALAYASICDPVASIRAGLAAFGRRKKLACHDIPKPADTAVSLPRAEAQLIPYLSHPSPATRRAAARTLARMKSTRGHLRMWEMVNRDPVWSIRRTSIRILTRVYKKKLLSVLRFSLTRDPDVRVRRVAMEALAFLKDPKSVNWLATSAKFESEPKAYKTAIKALELIGDKAAVSALAGVAEGHKDEDARAAAVRSLTKLKKFKKLTRPVLARVLKADRSGKVRAAALRALSTDRSATACSARAERINDPDAEVRQTVVEQLAKCPARIARPALAAAAGNDKNPRVRLAAVKLLIKGGARKAKATLVGLLLRDKDTAIRQRVLEAVLTLKKRDRSGPLAEVAKQDPDSDLRALAVEALAKLGSTQAVPPLVVVLERDRVEAVRAAAAKALSRFRDAAAYTALQKAASSDGSDKVRKIAAKGAAKSPAQKAFVNSLLPQTISTDSGVRLNAVTQLCALQVPRTYRALIRALWNDENAAVRTAVAKGFADIDHPLIDIGLSVAHTTDTDGGLVRTVELSQRTRMQRLARLLGEVQSSDPKIRRAAALALQPSPNSQVRKALEKVIKKDASARVRRAAAVSLARYRDRRAMQRLMQASQVEKAPKVRRKMGALYNKLRTTWSAGRRVLAINALINKLQAGDRRGKVAAARSLGTLRDRRAFQPLKTAAAGKDPALRYAAVVALATFGDVTIVSKSARTEKIKVVKEQLIQLNFLRKAPPEKVIAALSSKDTTEVYRAVETAGIKQINKAVPWLVRLSLSHVSLGVRKAAVRTLVLYETPLANWAVRVAAQHDASKKARKLHWRWAVFTDAGSSS